MTSWLAESIVTTTTSGITYTYVIKPTETNYMEVVSVLISAILVFISWRMAVAAEKSTRASTELLAVTRKSVYYSKKYQIISDILSCETQLSAAVVGILVSLNMIDSNMQLTIKNPVKKAEPTGVNEVREKVIHFNNASNMALHLFLQNDTDHICGSLLHLIDINNGVMVTINNMDNNYNYTQEFLDELLVPWNALNETNLAKSLIDILEQP